MAEDTRPAHDIEKRTSSSSEDGFVLATNPGNDQDGADMQRMGKKQQLNVCHPKVHCSARILIATCRGLSIPYPSWA